MYASLKIFGIFVKSNSQIETFSLGIQVYQRHRQVKFLLILLSISKANRVVQVQVLMSFTLAWASSPNYSD